MMSSDDPAARAAVDAVLADVLQRSRLAVALLAADGRIRWHNPTAAALLAGDTAADLLGLRLDGFLHPRPDLQAPREALAAAVAAGEAAAGLPELLHRGGERWLRVELQPLTDEQRRVSGVNCAAVVLDTTARRREREEADREGSLLREAARLGRIGAWDYDVEADRLRWSEETFGIHELPPGEAPRLAQAIDYYDEASRPAIAAAMATAVSQGQAFDLELGIVSAAARPRRVRAIGHAQREGGRIVRVAGLFHDITETASARQAIAELTERLRLATEAAGAGVWEWTPAPARVVWDAQMYRLHGLAPGGGALTLDDWAARLDAPSRAALAAEACRLRSGQAQLIDTTCRVVWPDGSLRQLQLLGRFVDTADGARRMVGICIDTSAREQHAQALLDKAAAERASRAKSEFLSRVSHELRTPLNGVLGFAQLLQQRAAELPGWTAEPLHLIRQAGDHLLALIDDMLDLGSIESGGRPLRLEPVALDAVAQDALRLVAPAAQAAGVVIEPWVVGGRWVRADATRLRQVLLNLLGNAVKFNRPGGRVALSWRAADGVLELRVRDTGVGIRAERRHELYQPFNRLGAEAGPVPGSGLGLAIARQLAEAMGGRLVVQPAPDQGTEALLTLHGADAPAAVAPAAVAVALAAGRACRVLYVEDHPVNALLVREALSQQQPRHRLQIAETGEQGLELLARDWPDLLLLDLNLPGISGYELLARLRARPGGDALPCIAVSADAMPDEVARARAAGFDDYWIKPLSLAGLAERIAAAAAAPRSRDPRPDGPGA